MPPDQQSARSVMATGAEQSLRLWRLRGLLLVTFSLLALPGQAMIDVNTNGLSDVWENLYGLTAVVPGDDLDGDGLSNYQESVAGTNPRNAASVFWVQSKVESSALLLWWPSVLGRR